MSNPTLSLADPADPGDATALATSLGLRNRSRAVGVMVMAGFAIVWAIAGAHHGAAGLLANACMVAGAMAFALGLRMRRDNRAPADPLPPELARWRRRAGRIFLWTSLAEGAGILLAVNLAVNLGHPECQFAAIMAVVGLHFLPLAFAFGYRPHVVTGVVMTAWALLYPALLADGAMAGAGLLGAAIVLLASAAWALRSAR